MPTLLFCPLDIAWGDVASWVEALGAIGVGVAAAFIAFYANRMNQNAIAAEAERTRAMRRALAALISPELKSASIKLSSMETQLRALATRVSPAETRWIWNQWKEVPLLPNSLTSVQAFGYLPTSTAELIGRILGLTSTTLPEMLRGLDSQCNYDVQDESGSMSTFSLALERDLTEKAHLAATFVRLLSKLANEAWECLIRDREPAPDMVATTMRQLGGH